MNYEIFGGFAIPRKPGKPRVADPRVRRAFWKEIDEVNPGLSGARGCYVFGIRAGRGILPWYVGKTCKQSFKGECFEIHKLRHYDDAMSDKMRGTPLLYFVARMTRSGRFATSAPVVNPAKGPPRGAAATFKRMIDG